MLAKLMQQDHYTGLFEPMFFLICIIATEVELSKENPRQTFYKDPSGRRGI